jgi:hypothetical protein
MEEVKTGTQIWMTKNFNLDSFKNGDLKMLASSNSLNIKTILPHGKRSNIQISGKCSQN